MGNAFASSIGVLRLSLWEWFKLRRRWMPWILLAILVLFPQIGAVGSYFIYRGDISSADLGVESTYSFSVTDNDGQLVEFHFTCDDIYEFQPESIESLPPETRMMVLDSVQSFERQCSGEGGLETSESREFFVMPASIANGLSAASFIGIIVAMVLAASMIGTEYAWGTLRTNLVSGVARRKFLTSKILTLLAVVAGGLLVTALIMALTSLLFTFLVRHVGGGWTEGDWATAFIMFGKVFYALVPYLMLAVFFAVLTSSTGVGTALAMGYYMVEAIAAGIMTGLFDWFQPVAEFLLGPNVAAWLSHNAVVQVTIGVSADADLGAWHNFLVLLAYTVALGAAAFWRFQRRDVAGAKGD